MNRLKPLLKWLTIFFGILGSLILLSCLYVSVTHGDLKYGDFLHYATLGKRPDTGEVVFSEYPTGEAPWYTFISTWALGFASLAMSALCFALCRFGSHLKRLKPVLKWLAIGCGILMVVVALFLLEENIRGKITLCSYMRQLRAQGEKLTLAEFNLPKQSKDASGVVTLMALTNQFEILRTQSPFDPVSMGLRIRLVGVGRAVVRCEQPDLGVNRRGLVASGRGRGRRDFEEAETNATTFVPVKTDWADLDELLTKASNVLERIKQASTQPVSSVEIDYSQGFDVRVPHLQPIRNATTWLGLAAMSDLHHRKLDSAAVNILAIARLSQFGRDERLLISQVHRWQLGLTGLNLTWEALQVSGWTDEQLFELEQVWRESSVAENTESILEINRLFYRSGFDRARKLPGWGALRDYLFGCWQGETWPSDVSEFFAYFRDSLHAFTWRLAWLDQDELRFLRRYQLMLDHARDAIARQDWSAFGLSDKDFPYDGKRFLLSDAYTPNVELILRRVFEFETQREMAIAAIGIKRFQLRTGKLPSDLTVLVPDYLPQLPHDWMDGKPLRYRTNPDETFTLYSVGLDGHDDGGDPTPAEGKRAFTIWNERDAVWPMPASEEDIAAFEQQTRQILNAGRRGLRSGQ